MVQSVRLNEGDALPYDPFALDETSNTQPTFFEIQFIKGDTLYRYGFEYDSNKIISEWLFEKRFGEREYDLFVRSQDATEVSPKRFSEGLGKEDLTNANRLFLSLVAQLKRAKKLRESYNDTNYATHKPCTMVDLLVEELEHPEHLLH